MSRRGQSQQKKTREVQADPKYNDVMVAKLINQVMLDGKKALARRIVYGAMDHAQEKTGKDGLEVFHEAMKNIMPVLEVKGTRIGGATYQVPMEVSPARRQTLAIRWMVSFARSRSERTMVERLGNEMVDACNNTGASVRRKEEMHRMAEANKAFAHYRY